MSKFVIALWRSGVALFGQATINGVVQRLSRGSVATTGARDYKEGSAVKTTLLLFRLACWAVALHTNRDNNLR